MAKIGSAGWYREYGLWYVALPLGLLFLSSRAKSRRAKAASKSPVVEPEVDDEDEESEEPFRPIPPIVEPEGAGLPPLPPAAFWAEPPEGSIVYPEGADPRGAPYLEDEAGAVFAPDCAIAVVGPDWWDRIGDVVEASGLDQAGDLLALVMNEEFPPDCDYDVAVGARKLRDELWGRINAHVAVTQE